MKCNIWVANPAGNITILVNTPVKKEAYAFIAEKLLSAVDSAEQVGFLVPPRCGGDVRLEMMGGEFCGNALRSAAFYYATENGCWGETKVLTEISGAAQPLPVLVDTGKNTATAAMPLPQKVVPVSFRASATEAVFFDGIVHFVTAAQIEETAVPEIEDYLRFMTKKYNMAAAGLMFYDDVNESLRPAVYVAATDTLFFENSCASGSAAVAAVRAIHEADGSSLLQLKEPGGIIDAAAEKRDGKIISLQIGGRIALLPEMEIQI